MYQGSVRSTEEFHQRMIERCSKIIRQLEERLPSAQTERQRESLRSKLAREESYLALHQARLAALRQGVKDKPSPRPLED